MAYEIAKPKNWQDFQKACVVLYQAELSDPHAQEYGRGGQGQQGIDILGRRHDKPDHFVGIQCRRVVAPLKSAKIEEDCRAALAIEAGLKEIIFATTAPDDVKATNAAIAVEKKLRAEGHEVIVALYGWESLQTRIALHPTAFAVFNPAYYATTATQALAPTPPPPDWTAQIGELLSIVKQQGISLQPSDPGSPDKSAEDPALHARIDVLRDLFQKHHQTLVAERQFRELLEKTSPDERPWAVFRLETNLASIDMELGREAEAAERFESAYALRPEDANAIANLALARTIQGRTDEAMELARQALATTPRADVAVAYLLQAAARSGWKGNPETLIPDDLKDSVSAAFGRAEFLRRRDQVDWAEYTIALMEQHPESEELKRAGALAVLELSIRNDAILVGKARRLPIERVRQSADDLKTFAERALDNGYTHDHDLHAYVSNASVLLRILDRDAEAESLLKRGIERLPNEVSLRRLLALAQWTLGRPDDARVTLSGTSDPESAMLRAEMMLAVDPVAALTEAQAITVPPGDERLERLRWRMIGEIAVKLGDQNTIVEAVAGLRACSADPLIAELIEVRSALAAMDSEDEARNAPLLALAGQVTEETDLVARYELAELLMRSDEAATAVSLLANHIDLTRAGFAGQLYLQALAAARFDTEFDTALSRASPALAESPDILWTRTARAWNIGDLDSALTLVDRLILTDPNSSRARLLKIEILARSDRTAELLTELDAPLERLNWKRFRDHSRLAELLGHFGHLDRAIALAYRLFLAHRDHSRAWLTLSGIVLGEGRSLDDRRWDVDNVGEHSAVDIKFDDGETRFLVVEPDPELRKIDSEAFEPDHALVRAMAGAPVGGSFIGPDGRKGTVTKLRHKYVARFHYVLEHFQTRFPEVAGFRRITVDIEGPDGLAPIREQARARQEWIEQETQNYLNGNWPLGLLAYRVGADPIDVAGGVAAAGHKLKVATGSAEEVNSAGGELLANGRKGVTLDLATFWTAWRLGALDGLETAFGQIHVSPSVVDRLRARRARLEAAIGEGIHWAQFDDGHLVVTEMQPDTVAEIRNDVSAALSWLQQHGRVVPIVADHKLPETLLDDIRRGRSDLFDCIAVALLTDTILISDDLFTREFMGLIAERKGAWLQLALRAAKDGNAISMDNYVRWIADLIEAGHSYLGCDGNTLAHAAKLDAEVGAVPGRLFRIVTSVIGGAIAEPASHLSACFACLNLLWNDRAALGYREPATGHMLRQLIRERTEDYGAMLRLLYLATGNAPRIREYLMGWLRGHFIPMSALVPAPPRRPARTRRNRTR